jgi:uncharacterized membrane protein YhaH (DUF805 family)
MTPLLSLALFVPTAALALTLIDRIPAGPWHRFRSALYQRHMRARLARGSDAYFEELRALKAYSPEGPRPLAPFWRSFLINLIFVAVPAVLFAITNHLIWE